MLNKLWILSLSIILFAPVADLNAKTMEQFYGSQLYDGSYDFNDLYRSLTTDAVFDRRVGFKGVAASGRHVNVKITESDSGNVVRDRQKVWQSLHKIAASDNQDSIDSLNTCKFYHSYLLDQDIDDQVNLQVTIKNMPIWRVLREPAKLRSTRHKIYFNKRAVRILNSRLKSTTDDNKFALLTKVKEHFQEKVEVLYEMHTHLMEQDLTWKTRRWVVADFENHDVRCFNGDSYNAETWYEVKKEISVIEDKIKEVMEANKVAE